MPYITLTISLVYFLHGVFNCSADIRIMELPKFTLRSLELTIFNCILTLKVINFLTQFWLPLVPFHNMQKCLFPLQMHSTSPAAVTGLGLQRLHGDLHTCTIKGGTFRHCVCRTICRNYWELSERRTRGNISTITLSDLMLHDNVS